MSQSVCILRLLEVKTTSFKDKRKSKVASRKKCKSKALKMFVTWGTANYTVACNIKNCTLEKNNHGFKKFTFLFPWTFWSTLDLKWEHTTTELSLWLLLLYSFIYLVPIVTRLYNSNHRKLKTAAIKGIILLAQGNLWYIVFKKISSCGPSVMAPWLNPPFASAGTP